MSEPRATRGARKLAAAIDDFGLAARIAGTRAIDIGASTGGFTATLLACGAREVTAIDVGHDQLAPELRSDPRVIVHEGTDVRRAPLALAEGPFDFFTVDVSFMAARNTLRPLAFRLRAGAEGIVLLKPQFELPKPDVRGGDVSDPSLRRKAFARFSARAQALGFSVVEQRDSAVAGGSGTVEIFLHLRFAGRPESLPKPGEQRRGRTERAQSPGPKPRTATEPRTCFAIAAPGVEPHLLAEIGEIAGVRAPRALPGGVEFEGGVPAAYAVNLRSRLATRVVVRLGTVKAHQFSDLRRRMQALPFEAFVAPGRSLRIDVSARRCRLYHTKALAEALQLAVSDRLGADCPLVVRSTDTDDDDAPEAPGSAGLEPFSRLLLRGENDLFTLSVDTSGELLHKRGSRALTGRAPLRETLAAALLRIAGYRGDEILVNAMCGAGTIAFEAADIARRRAPGSARRFAFEGFPSFDARLYEQLRAASEAEVRPPPAPILAFDRDPRTLELARRNARAAGIADVLQITEQDLLRYQPPAASGLLIANPPYGKRLGHAREVHQLYRAIGAHLRRVFTGWRVALLVPRGVPAELFGLDRADNTALSNGGVAVQLIVGSPRGSTR